MIKKWISVMVAFAIAAFSAVLCFAATLADGVYSVPVMLYHSEKDKESMGNKYILPTALLTVENGKKTITVITDGVDNLTFSYYLDGTVAGETAQAKTVHNVEIDGKTYETGFAFPLVTDDAYVGVTFKAPIMPMTPSARLKIEYSKIKMLAPAETVAARTEAAAVETQPAEESTTAEASATAVKTEPATALERETVATEPQQTEAPDAAEPSAESEVSAGSSVAPVLIVAGVAAAAVIAGAVVFGRKKNKN